MADKTKTYLELQIADLKDQLKTANDALANVTEKMEEQNMEARDILIREIVDKSTFKAEDLADKSIEELTLISTSLERVKAAGTFKGVGKDSGTEKDSGRTVGQWNPETKKWEA